MTEVTSKQIVLERALGDLQLTAKHYPETAFGANAKALLEEIERLRKGHETSAEPGEDSKPISAKLRRIAGDLADIAANPPVEMDSRALARLSSQLLAVAGQVSLGEAIDPRRAENGTPNATPGAMLTGEDSLRFPGESLRPRELQQLRARVVQERWSGHGEGGVIARVVIEGGYRGDPYYSTPEDIAAMETKAASINAALDHETSAPQRHLQGGQGHSQTINTAQLQQVLEFVDNEPDTQVEIEWLPERTADNGDKMEAGLYCWLTEYPEEGVLLLDPNPSSTEKASAPLIDWKRSYEEAIRQRDTLVADAARYRFLREFTYVEAYYIDGAGGADTKVRCEGSVDHLDLAVDMERIKETRTPSENGTAPQP